MIAESAIYPLVEERIPFDTYRSLPGENATGLLQALKSAKAYRHHKTHERDDTDTYRIGRATHTGALEPMEFMRSYVMYDGRRAGKDWEAFAEKHASKTILKPDQYEQAAAMAEALRSHPIAGKYLAEKGRAELTVRWRHSSGVLCKARIDWLCSVLADIKTTSAPDEDAFAVQSYKLGYHIRMAFYLDAVRAAFEIDPPVKLFVVPKEEPHDVWVMPMDAAALDVGREKYSKAIALIEQCRKSNVWPGRAEDREIDLKLPHWAAPNFNEAEAIEFGDAVIS